MPIEYIRAIMLGEPKHYRFSNEVEEREIEVGAFLTNGVAMSYFRYIVKGFTVFSLTLAQSDSENLPFNILAKFIRDF